MKILNKLICKLFGHKKKYSMKLGWIGYSNKCSRCKKSIYKKIKDYRGEIGELYKLT